MPRKICEPRPKSVSIKNWPAGERPREKMISLGVENLTSAELLAVLISSGTGHLNALDIGKELIRYFETLQQLAVAARSELMRVEGIGPAKALILQAAFQLSRNMQREMAQQKFHFFKQPGDVARFFIPQIGHLKQEVFISAMLDSAGRYLHSETIFKGTLNASLVHPREVFKSAIRFSAASIILIHNHPSGQLLASPEDLRVTRQLIATGKVLEIPVQDHLIIADDKYISLREEGGVFGE
jgi:DNA repair protein RadC